MKQERLKRKWQNIRRNLLKKILSLLRNARKGKGYVTLKSAKNARMNASRVLELKN